jgi:hypothetical protein
MNNHLLENINRIKSLMNIHEGETQFGSKEKQLIDDFVKFVKNELKIQNEIDVRLQTDKEGIKTTAIYNYEEGKDKNIKNSTIRVYTTGRAIVDILRSIAHEFVHHQQNEKGKLENVSKSPGSPVENEANSVAGELVRKFGENHPEIYGEDDKKTEVKEAEESSTETSTPPASATSKSGGGETKSTSTVSKWESGVTRGPGNQVANTVWTDKVGRGPGNQISNTVWSSDIKRGKANPLI